MKLRPPRMLVPLALVLALACACADREDDARREGRELVEAFDAVMDAPPAQRAPRVARLRALAPTEPRVRRARERCLLLFDSIARASSLQDRLEPMARDLDAYADAGRPVPAERRAEILRLYGDAQAATEAAASALAPCTEAMNGVRSHHARRR